MSLRRLCITVIALVCLTAGHGALAQGEHRESATDDETIDNIVVTGSRIKRRDFNTTSPLTTISTEDIDFSGQTTIEETLNQMPQVMPGYGRTLNFHGDGTAGVDLRGLGPGRSLVLLNGRRVAPTGTGNAVDLNNIPQLLIERVEIITGGASTVYGSDAIAGVVNIITKKPSAEPVNSFSLSGGSFDTYRASLFRSDRKEKFDYSLGYSGFSTNGDYDFERPTFKSGGITIKPNPASATRINNDSEQQALDAKIGRDFDFGRLQFSDNIMRLVHTTC